MEIQLSLNKTPALTLFKKLMGQSNHALITILVGLDGVKNGAVAKDPNFRAKWEPINLENTAQLARVFAKRATLAWIIDSLDAYMNQLRKSCYGLQNYDDYCDLESRSVYKKFKATRNLALDDRFETSLIHLAIQWRNKATHFDADNELDSTVLARLKKASKLSEDISYCGLDILRTLENFKESITPSFKEVATIYKCTYSLVREIDNLVLNRINYNLYIQFLTIQNKALIKKIDKFKEEKKKKQNFKSS